VAGRRRCAARLNTPTRRSGANDTVLKSLTAREEEVAGRRRCQVLRCREEEVPGTSLPGGGGARRCQVLRGGREVPGTSQERGGRLGVRRGRRAEWTGPRHAASSEAAGPDGSSKNH
jgi:hypothetical protein